MSRRKWAWEAYREGGDPDERAVESAAVGDFLNDVLERLGELEETAERTGNPNVVLGIALATDALRQLGDEWEAL
jgi:hypothetical protein